MEPHDGPEWGYCTHAGCVEAAEPLWYSGAFPDEPDLLLCNTHTGVLIGRLEARRRASEQERDEAYQVAQGYEAAAVHFLHCRQCAEGSWCNDGEHFASLLGMTEEDRESHNA
jgi:hypothetical protein